MYDHVIIPLAQCFWCSYPVCSDSFQGHCIIKLFMLTNSEDVVGAVGVVALRCGVLLKGRICLYYLFRLTHCEYVVGVVGAVALRGGVLPEGVRLR